MLALDAQTVFETATNGAVVLERLMRTDSINSRSFEQVSAVHVTRVFPQPNREFVIQYALTEPGSAGNGRRNRIMWGRLFRTQDQTNEYARTNPDQIMVVDDLPLAIPVFPFDPALPLLSTVSDAKKWTDSLRNQLARFDVSQPTPLLAGVDVLAYRLERRAVLKLALTDSNERGRMIAVIVKVVPPRKAHRFERRLTELQSAIAESGQSRRLRVPLVYGIDVSNGMIFMEYVPGQDLHTMIGTANDFVVACSAVGELLSTLHELPQRDLPRVSAETEIQQLHGLAETIIDVRPDVSKSAGRAILDLEKQMSALSDSDPACLHTDFYDKQVLWSGGRPTLLDFENLATGDRAKDVGNFLAHLELRSLQDPDARGIREGGQGFLHHYNADNVPSQNVQWWKNASTIRLAMLYSLRPKWRHLAASMIAEMRTT